MRKLLSAVTASALSILLFSSLGYASGFRLPEQSASASGMAGAFVGQADDPSAVWYNPAGITQLDGTQVSAGIITLYPIFTHETDSTTDVSKRTFHFPVFFYGTHKVNDKVSLGLGINNPFGLATDWSATSETRQVATFTKIVTTEINPNIAFKINNNLSVAAGIGFVHARATIENIWPTGQNLRIAGDGDGWGGNLALHYKATDQLNCGLAYRSRIKIDLDGTADYAGGLLSNPASTKITLPDLLQFGVSYKASDKLTLNADLDYTFWSTYDRIQVESTTFALIGNPTGSTLKQEKQWKDVWAIRVGGQYKLTDQWKLRAGYMFDKNPIKDEYFDPRVPDSDRHMIALGAGYTIDKITIDANYVHLWFKNRTINDSTADDDTLTPNALNGTYKSYVDAAIIMVSYKF